MTGGGSGSGANNARKPLKTLQSEEESPTQVQQRNVREAEMLTSNLGESGISQHEILGDISVLKELAILQESMEWFALRISDFANDLRQPLGVGSVTADHVDGTIKVLTNLALEFDDLANTCLLVLHLEVSLVFACLCRSEANCFVGSGSRAMLPLFASQLGGASERDLRPRSRYDGAGRESAKVHQSAGRYGGGDAGHFASAENKSEWAQRVVDGLTHSLQRRTFFQYIFEGLAHLAARILISAANYMESIDEAGVQRMCRNALSLKQTLGSITSSREVSLDQTVSFYEMFYKEPQVSRKILSHDHSAQMILNTVCLPFRRRF